MHCLTRVFLHHLLTLPLFISLSLFWCVSIAILSLYFLQVLYTTLNANRDAIVISDDVLRIQYVNIAAELLLHIKMVSGLNGFYAIQQHNNRKLNLFLFLLFILPLFFCFYFFFFQLCSATLYLYISLSYVSFFYSRFSVYLLSPCTTLQILPFLIALFDKPSH